MKKKPFAARIQNINIIVLLCSFVLIAQPWVKELYIVGIVVIMISALLQNAFGNIRSDLDFKESMKGIAKILLIILILFVVSILIAPYLVQLGRA